jgi:hypothetical protein
MTRPHIEFIQAQSLPWMDGLYGGARPDVQVRTLSMDDETGASSLLIRYPRGWKRTVQEHLLADEELFVIAGSLVINGNVYDRYSYAYLPAGFGRREASSPNGALVLTFYEGEPKSAPGADESTDRSTLIEHVSSFDGDWGGNFHAQFPPGAGRKWLREQSPIGDQTWVLGTLPIRWGRRPEKHPVVEEMLLIAGHLRTPLGTMYGGGYFWRPPEIWHGPFGSLTGTLQLFRTKGGPLSTVYREAEPDFSWTPEHRPVLTPELAYAGSKALDWVPAIWPDVDPE